MMITSKFFSSKLININRLQQKPSKDWRKLKMITIRKAEERGHANHGWLDTYHTFSFSGYYNPEFMGFRSLRVINEDRVLAGRGFGTHGHRDMEIISYVVSGALAHKDSTGGEEILRPHEVQRMTAGSGIQHSEYNPLKDENVHFLQIWILPEKENLTPGYEQKLFAPEDKKGKLKLVASRAGTDGSVSINQDLALYASILDKDEQVSHELAENRHSWIQVIKGSLEINGKTLNVSDGAAISDEKLLEIKSLENETEFLLFDLN